MFSPQSTNRNPPNSLDFVCPFFSLVSPIQQHLRSLYKYHCLLPSFNLILVKNLVPHFQVSTWKLTSHLTWRYIDILATIWQLYILPCTCILLIVSTYGGQKLLSPNCLLLIGHSLLTILTCATIFINTSFTPSNFSISKQHFYLSINSHKPVRSINKQTIFVSSYTLEIISCII